MGTKERKQRQLAERETQFLDASRELIAENGLLNLQVSKVAERCEYAVGTLYQHFASKEDLVLALTTAQTHVHVELFQRVAQWNAPTRDKMFAIAVADTIFVRQHPEHFRMAQYALCEVVWRAASESRRQEFLEAGRCIGEIVIGIVRDAVSEDDLILQGLLPEDVCTGVWALTNGTHNLVHAEGVLQMFTEGDSYRLMCRHVQTLLNGWGWKPLADLSDEQAIDRLVQRITDEVFHDLCPSS